MFPGWPASDGQQPSGPLAWTLGGGGQLAQRWLAPSANRAASFFLPSAPGSWGHRLVDPWSQLARRSGKPASRSVLWVRNFGSLSLSRQLWKVPSFHTTLPALVWPAHKHLAELLVYLLCGLCKKLSLLSISWIF